MTNLFQTLWQEQLAFRSDLLAAFFDLVQKGVSREKISDWLPSLIRLIGRTEGAFTAEQVCDLTEFLCTCYYAQRAREPLPDFSENQQMSHHPQSTRPIKETVPMALLPLEERLLAIGGRRLVYVGEPDLASLLARGQEFASAARLIRGETSRCHGNAANLWYVHQDRLALGTGYGLSGDGLWRQHSWCVRTQPRSHQRKVLETTERRVHYFGYVLNPAEAEAFWENHQSNGYAYPRIEAL